MGINLQRIGGILNPFDGPKAPARTPAPQQARPQVASTPAPGGGSRLSPQQALANPRFGRSNIAQLVQQSAASNPAPYRFKTALGSQLTSRDTYKKAGEGLSLGLTRSLIGTGQAVSGLADLAGKSEGTSRVSKLLNQGAVNLDQTAKRDSVGGAYKVGQLAGDTGTFLLPGGLVKAIPKASKLGKVAGLSAKLAAPAEKLLAKGAADLATMGVGGRVASAGLKSGLSGTNLVNAAVGTLQDIGQGASKGQKITPQRIATDAAVNLSFGTGLGVAGQLGKEAVPAAKAVAKERQAALKRINQDGAAKREQYDLNQKQAELINQRKQAQAAGLPANHPAIKNIDKGLAQLDQQQMSIQAPKQTLRQKFTDPILTAQPGFSTRDVSKQNIPELPDAKAYQTKVGHVISDGSGNKFTVVSKPWSANALNSDFASVKDSNGKFIKNMNLRGMKDETYKPAPTPDTAPTTKPTTQLPNAAALAKPEKNIVKGALGNSTPALPLKGTTKVPLIDKALRSTRSIIERQGQHGKELANRLQATRDTEEIYQGQLQKQLPTVRSLKGKDFENFVDATQGKAKTNSPKIEQAIKEWQAVHPTIRQRAVDAGLDVGDLGKNYYPHFIDYDKVFGDTNTYNKAVNHLVESGQAKTQEEAIKLLGYARDVSRNRSFGNLEAAREVDLPFYDKTPDSLVSYIRGSTKRIAQTENLGAKDEKALALIAKAGQEGYDTEAMKEAYDVASGAKKYGQTATKFSNGLRSFQSTTRLGLGAITNSSQNVNTGIVTGHLRTLGAAVKQLDPKTRSFVQDTGVIADSVLQDLKTQSGFTGKVLGKITAPGFSQVEKLNRSISATAGRDYGLRLAQTGNERQLRRLGVTGEIANKTLTEAQQIQVARKVVEKTQFKVDPQDLPGWADSPGGKLVSQFRTFSYAQGKFVSNEILKPLKPGKGFDVKPLGRLLAALPLGYGLYEAKRTINGRPEETSATKRGLATYQNVGGAGLAFDIYQGLNPPNSKYTPSDRRVTMGVGTLAGPTAGLAAQTMGAVSDLIQRKNTPVDPSKLGGKVVVGNNGKTYTDATQAARLALSQIPIVGNPIKNRVLPYKKQSDAEAGYADSPKPSKGGPFEALGQILSKVTGQTNTSAATLTPDQAIAKVKADKKAAEVTYKSKLSKSDYQLSTLDKQSRQKLIDQGVTSADKLKGLDSYAAKQKTDLGLTSPKKSNVSTTIDPHSQKVLNEYNNLDTATRDSKLANEKDYAYKVAQAKYDNESANGTLTRAEDIKAQDGLQKDKVGSGFTKDTRDIYGLSKSDIYDLITTDSNGKQIASDLQAYDKALQDAGLEKNLKFKYGFGSSNGSGRKSGYTAGKKGKTAKTSASKVSYSGLNKATRSANTKFRLPGAKSSKSSSVKLATYKAPKAYTIKKPKLTRSYA